jgi:hypothetical protein
VYIYIHVYIYPYNAFFIIFSLKHGPVAPWMVTINRIMSPIRVAIEWIFGKVIARSKHADYRQYAYKSPVTKIFYLSVLLTNCHTCLYGSQCDTTFFVAPPSIDDYLNQ